MKCKGDVMSLVKGETCAHACHQLLKHSCSHKTVFQGAGVQRSISMGWLDWKGQEATGCKKVKPELEHLSEGVSTEGGGMSPHRFKSLPVSVRG